MVAPMGEQVFDRPEAQSVVGEIGIHRARGGEEPRSSYDEIADIVAAAKAIGDGSQRIIAHDCPAHHVR